MLENIAVNEKVYNVIQFIRDVCWFGSAISVRFCNTYGFIHYKTLIFFCPLTPKLLFFSCLHTDSYKLLLNFIKKLFLIPVGFSSQNHLVQNIENLFFLPNFQMLISKKGANGLIISLILLQYQIHKRLRHCFQKFIFKPTS